MNLNLSAISISIKNLFEFVFGGQREEAISDSELQVSKELYIEEKSTGKRSRLKVIDVTSKLGITDMRTLNSSRFIDVVNDHFQLSEYGVRYMDTLARKGKLLRF